MDVLHAVRTQAGGGRRVDAGVGRRQEVGGRTQDQAVAGVYLLGIEGIQSSPVQHMNGIVLCEYARYLT